MITRIKSSILILIFSNTILMSCGLADNIYTDRIVAIVNSDIITQSELDSNLSFVYMQLSERLDDSELEREFTSYKDVALYRMIEDKLILQEAKRQNLKINEAVIESRLAEIRNEFSSQEEFNLFLSSQGLTLKDIKQKFYNELLMKGIIDIEIKDKIVIHPQEITNFYKDNIERFKEKESFEMELISVSLEEKDRLQEDLKTDNNFYALQEKYNQAGRSITLHKGEFREDIEEAIHNLEVGEVSELFEVNPDVYVFRLRQRNPGYTRPLSELQDIIYQMLSSLKMQERLSQWLKELKDEAYIVIK